MTFIELFESEIQQFNKALDHNFIRIQNHLPDICEFIRSIPEEENGIKIISPLRKWFYIHVLENRFNKILLPAYQRLTQ